MSQIAVPYFLYSVGILFREGTEAMLVVIALASPRSLTKITSKQPVRVDILVNLRKMS